MFRDRFVFLLSIVIFVVTACSPAYSVQTAATATAEPTTLAATRRSMGSGSGMMARAEMSGNMENMQQEMLARLLEERWITQYEADAFTTAHDKLLEAGLME